MSIFTEQSKKVGKTFLIKILRRHLACCRPIQPNYRVRILGQYLVFLPSSLFIIFQDAVSYVLLWVDQQLLDQPFFISPFHPHDKQQHKDYTERVIITNIKRIIFLISTDFWKGQSEERCDADLSGTLGKYLFLTLTVIIINVNATFTYSDIINLVHSSIGCHRLQEQKQKKNIDTIGAFTTIVLVA